MSKRYPQWLVKWNAAKTCGLVWRTYGPGAPCVEGVLRRGPCELSLRDAKAYVKQMMR